MEVILPNKEQMAIMEAILAQNKIVLETNAKLASMLLAGPIVYVDTEVCKDNYRGI